MSATTKEKQFIRLLPGTRAKLEHIAAERRWKLNVVVDEAIKRFIEVEGIELPATGNRRSKVPA